LIFYPKPTQQLFSVGPELYLGGRSGAAGRKFKFGKITWFELVQTLKTWKIIQKIFLKSSRKFSNT
jgi:hypothetical protein